MPDEVKGTVFRENQRRYHKLLTNEEIPNFIFWLSYLPFIDFNDKKTGSHYCPFYYKRLRKRLVKLCDNQLKQRKLNKRYNTNSNVLLSS
jgi:hypothetical protein